MNRIIKTQRIHRLGAWNHVRGSRATDRIMLVPRGCRGDDLRFRGVRLLWESGHYDTAQRSGRWSRAYHMAWGRQLWDRFAGPQEIRRWAAREAWAARSTAQYRVARGWWAQARRVHMEAPSI
jgi:hypothetical protein